MSQVCLQKRVSRFDRYIYLASINSLQISKGINSAIVAVVLKV